MMRSDWKISKLLIARLSFLLRDNFSEKELTFINETFDGRDIFEASSSALIMKKELKHNE
jgi:hypothetical protein